MMLSLRSFSCAVATTAAILCFAAPTRAADDLKITIEAGQHDRRQTPVSTVVELPQSWADQQALRLAAADGRQFTAQLSEPALLSNAPAAQEGHIRRQLTIVIDELKAGQSLELAASKVPGKAAPAPKFAWRDTPGVFTELSDGGKPVLRYMYRPLDESSSHARFETYKVFHHLYDPAGERIVTNGPTGEEPYSEKVRFPHHRGLFYGFNRISYGDGKSADTWHCRGKAYLSHDEFQQSEAGEVFGRHRLRIGWHGQEGEIFANETREMTAYRVGDAQLIEFASRLESAGGKIHVDGDPQHAGFQFRAHVEVAAQTSSQSYYVRTDGKGKPGETRNWSKGNDECENRPWNALSFVLGDQRYTAVYLDRPQNPKPARYSERDYGRFGSYFFYDLDEAKPLDVNYRVWLQAGELSADDAARLSADFVDPPKVTVN
ncbi:MAG: PmoA family protein [Planctomycetales bacterium]|nr:PmoA family protein [Planctomycetales bacterium]